MSALIVAATTFPAPSLTVMLVYSQANCQGLLLWGMQVEGQLAMFASRLRMHAPNAANALTAMASDAGIADFTTASEGGLSSAYTTGIRLSHVQTYAVPLPHLAGANACFICCSRFVMSLSIASGFLRICNKGFFWDNSGTQLHITTNVHTAAHFLCVVGKL